METHDLTRSLDRLEAALFRAEQALETLSSPASGNERLRQEVARSVEALDRLLERQGG